MREKLNLFYYTLFRFERFTQNLISKPMHSGVKFIGLNDTMAERTGREDWDDHIMDVLNDPKGGFSVHFTGLHITLLLTLFCLALFCLLCTLFGVFGDNVWYVGMVACAALGFLTSHFVAPLDPKNFLKDFKRFEALPKVTKRKHALLTFLIVIGIWIVFVLSFVYYLQSIPR